jgi:diguanylate cyclase (GGDEF)-like protein
MSIRTAPQPKVSSPPSGDNASNLPLDRTPRDALLTKLANNPHLPSPPSVVLQVLERASRLDCSPSELAAIIHRDPVMCGKILKTINSALYSLPRAVSSIERAIALLGFKPVRSLAIGLSLPAMQHKMTCPPPSPTFWKESVAGAIIAQELSAHLRRPSPDDDLVAGLLRDLGMLALQQLDPSGYARILSRPPGELAREQCRLEEEAFGIHHAEVSAFLLGRWRLPDDITEAIRYHHAPELAADLPQPVVERARLLAFAGRIARLPATYGEAEAGDAEQLGEILALAREQYGLNEADLAAFLEPAVKKIEEFAQLMDLNIGCCDHYARIIALASEELVKLTVENSADKLRILEQKREAEQETLHWRNQVRRLRNESRRDRVTDAFNRGCLEEELALQFRRARRRGTVLGLVFLDLDDFKGINDRSGHLFGDRVLRETADRLFTSVRDGDIVARYGGDEFCVLIENTSPNGLRAMTERLWKDFNRRTFSADGCTAVLRASLGAVVCLPRTYTLAAKDFLAEADRAMYAAKTTGKNQISFVSLLTAADERFLAAVEKYLIGGWLAERGIWKPQHLGIGVRRSESNFEAPGRLARRLGWLTTTQLRPILREQRLSGRRFDQVALERGLSIKHLHVLQAIQLEPPEALAAHLVNQGVVGELAMRGHIRNYYQWIHDNVAQ